MSDHHDVGEEIDAMRQERDEAIALVEHARSWAGLMETLDQRYPADLTAVGAILDGPGGRIVRLVRELESALARVAHLENVLLVERGEGVPPSGGWRSLVYLIGRIVWRRQIGDTWVEIGLRSDRWRAIRENSEGVELANYGRFTTAFACMEAVNAALAAEGER